MAHHPSGAHRDIRYRLYRRPGHSQNYVAYLKVRGQRHDFGLGSSLIHVAIAQLHKRIDILLDGRPREALLQDLVAAYWRDLKGFEAKGKIAAHTLVVTRPQLRRFLAFCHAQGVRSASGLSAGLVNAYRTWLLHEADPDQRPGRQRTAGKAGFAPTSIENETACTIGPLLRRAGRRDVLDGVHKYPARDREQRIFSRQEWATLLRGVRRQPYGRSRAKLLRFYYWTGCRRNQARLLAWDKLDLGRRRATLLAQKRHPPLEIPLSGRLVRMLGSIERNCTPHVFGKTSKDAPLKWLRRAAKEAGILQPFRLHDTRSTFASTLLNVYGIPIQDVARLLGHTRLDQTRKYQKVDLDALERQVNRIR